MRADVRKGPYRRTLETTEPTENTRFKAGRSERGRSGQILRSARWEGGPLNTASLQATGFGSGSPSRPWSGRTSENDEAAQAP
jgi:hypothetical protein